MKKIFTILGLSVAFFSNAQIVINEVYGGGGSVNSSVKQDYIELINNTATVQTLNGAYLQYGGATSTTTIGASNIQALPNITLNPGQTFLIVEAGNSGGTDISSLADHTGTLNIGGSGGKLLLTSDNTAVSDPTTATNIIDRVSWGTNAVWSETAPAGATSTTTSVSRTGGVDTGNNSVDFTVGAPTPKNSANATLGVSDVNSVKSNFVRNTMVNNEIKFGTKAEVKVYNMNGQVVRSASVSENNNLEVSDLAPGMYIVTGTVNGEAVSQKILKK